MKIRYEVGGMFEVASHENPVTPRFLAHGCNAQGVMGSGVAKEVKERYPECFNVYVGQLEEWKKNLPSVEEEVRFGGGILGRVIDYFDARDSITIFNCITQDFYGRTGKRFVDYGAVSRCFDRINSHMVHLGAYEYPIYLPKIGAGLGGGDWSIISNLIENSCTKIHPVVCVLHESEIPRN